MSANTDALTPQYGLQDGLQDVLQTVLAQLRAILPTAQDVFEVVTCGMRVLDGHTSLAGKTKTDVLLAALEEISKGVDGQAGTADDLLSPDIVRNVRDLLEGGLAAAAIRGLHAFRKEAVALAIQAVTAGASTAGDRCNACGPAGALIKGLCGFVSGVLSRVLPNKRRGRGAAEPSLLPAAPPPSVA